MIIFLQELCMQLFLWLLMLIDGLMEIFSALSGVTNITVHGQQVNILEYIVGDSTVSAIFWCIFILAVGLTCMFTIVGLVKNMIANNRNISSIVGKFFLALLGSLAMLAVVILGILIANSVLQLLAKIFQIGNTTKISSAVFDACVGDWVNGYSIKDVDIKNLSVSDIFGTYKTAALGIWPASWKNNGMVNPNSFMYLPALIAGIAMAIALIVAVLNLAKRIYEIVFLYLTMPMSLSTLAMDDGARFKNWREMFLTKIVLAYGSVLAVNVFILILPLITQMKISGISSFGSSMFLIFMIVGGAMVIPAGQTLFARLFGQADDMHAGGNFLHSAFYGGRMLGGMTLGLVAKGIRGISHLMHNRNSNNSGDSGSSSNGDASGGESEDKFTDDDSSSTESEGGGTE
ncbi:MAG: hypothetical protein J1F65_00100 [Clostridiales bacterium]|nr:hypothetical protein [Clostridiales bacterium]